MRWNCYKPYNIWKNFTKLCHQYEKSACFASFALKKYNFAQILENFARTYVRVSVRFRTSGS